MIDNYTNYTNSKKLNTPKLPPRAQLASALLHSFEICVIYPHLGICPGIYIYFINFFPRLFFSLRPVMYNNKTDSEAV